MLLFTSTLFLSPPVILSRQLLWSVSFVSLRCIFMQNKASSSYSPPLPDKRQCTAMLICSLLFFHLTIYLRELSVVSWNICIFFFLASSNIPFCGCITDHLSSPFLMGTGLSPISLLPPDNANILQTFFICLQESLQDKCPDVRFPGEKVNAFVAFIDISKLVPT